MSHDDHDESHEPLGYGTYILTWFSLLFLTAITVGVAGFHLGNLSVVVALVVACIKATIVLYIFMHLKHEKQLFHTMLVLVIIALTVFIGLTFTDTWFR